MGCDYYQYFGVIAYFKNDEACAATYGSEPIYGCHFTYDEDRANDFENEQQKWINEQSQSKVIYEGNAWLIDSLERIDYYINLLEREYNNTGMEGYYDEEKYCWVEKKFRTLTISNKN